MKISLKSNYKRKATILILQCTKKTKHTQKTILLIIQDTIYAKIEWQVVKIIFIWWNRKEKLTRGAM